MDNLTINADVTMGGAGGALLAGRYRVVRQLGQGGMGSVWLAEDTKLDGFKVAIKMLPSVLVNNRRAYAQVKTEALVSLKLSHPNIATVRAFEEENGNPFLVMDYIDGQTLDDYLAERCVTTTPSSSCPADLPEDEVIRLLKPVAAALDYAHTQGVVHRDVKPGNVMIRKDGTPFVLDFGIAREIQETMTRVTGKLSSGTLLYMSPEQLRGTMPTPAQDIYSFAAMAYECLTGNPPFARGQIEYQIEHDTPEPLPRHIAICRGVMAGLAKAPEARPATCAAVLSAGSRVPRDRADVGADASETRIGSSGDSEYERIHEEIKRYEGILAQREAEKKAAEDARQRQLELQKAKERLENLRRQVEVETSGCKAGDVKEVELPGGAKIEMVYCPPGSFIMGSPESEEGRDSDEKQHQVTFSQGFWIGKYAVTQKQWNSVMGCGTKKEKVFFGLIEWDVSTNPSWLKGDDLPVENISWDDCQEFIRKVNSAGDVIFSLPTEAQWEYACRAGTTTPFNFGSTLNGDKANCDGNVPYGRATGCIYRGVVMPVGSYAPNAWGLYDMHGNVWEWCLDWYGTYQTASGPERISPVSGVGRVLRGGSWSSVAQCCRAAFRYKRRPSCHNHSLGFRLVCSDGPRK